MSHWGLDVEVVPLTELDSVDLPQLVASTLPGNAGGLPAMPARVVATAALFDVAYSPWPSAFAHQWANSPQPIVSGLWMLAYQALAQIRLFVHGDVSRPLSAEDAVFRAMTDAVGLNSGS
jgi:shikimate dehydrogenase